MAFKGPGGPNVRAGNDTDDLEIIRFFPSQLTVKAGSTVRWFAAHPHEFHTVTFGPQAYLEPIGRSFIAPDQSAPQGGPPTLVLNPVVMSPAGGTVFNGTGLANSGWLQREAAEVYEGFPREGEVTYELTFDTPGEYRYYCAIHAGGPDDEQGMTGVITVS